MSLGVKQRRASQGGPILCGPPTGVSEWLGIDWRTAPACPNKATHRLTVDCSRMSGGWWLCPNCYATTLFWIDELYGDASPVYKTEAIP